MNTVFMRGHDGQSGSIGSTISPSPLSGFHDCELGFETYSVIVRKTIWNLNILLEKHDNFVSLWP